MGGSGSATKVAVVSLWLSVPGCDGGGGPRVAGVWVKPLAVFERSEQSPIHLPHKNLLLCGELPVCQCDVNMVQQQPIHICLDAVGARIDGGKKFTVLLFHKILNCLRDGSFIVLWIRRRCGGGGRVG